MKTKKEKITDKNRIADWAKCKKHPTYIGKKKPTSDCKQCHVLYLWMNEDPRTKI